MTTGAETTGPAATGPPAAGPAASGRVQSVDRAARLLAAVAAASPQGDTLARLAASVDLNRATAWRLLSTLEGNGLVDRDPATNRYQLGFALVRMAAATGYGGLVRRARPVLERLSAQVGETVAVAVAGRHGVVYVDEVASPAVLSVNWVSREVPLHATSTGKALLAWLPEQEARDLLGTTLERYTTATVTDPERLLGELRETRARGYACCAGELEDTLYGVSAPLLSADGARPAAVLSIWGPADRIPTSRFDELGTAAMAAAGDILDLVGPGAGDTPPST